MLPLSFLSAHVRAESRAKLNHWSHRVMSNKEHFIQGQKVLKLYSSVSQNPFLK